MPVGQPVVSRLLAFLFAADIGGGEKLKNTLLFVRDTYLKWILNDSHCTFRHHNIFFSARLFVVHTSANMLRIPV